MLLKGKGCVCVSVGLIAGDFLILWLIMLQVIKVGIFVIAVIVFHVCSMTLTYVSGCILCLCHLDRKALCIEVVLLVILSVCL